ncbi:MAG: accessory factor UbiK family protein [Rhodospirillales bacterium]|jgi:BMFP domain-containing protein YqiC|nr:accessory factor UbiK family protein [Rhodospirillales bacterium]
MQTSNRILDDLARVANGAVSTLTGIREELEAMIRHQLERLLADRDTVPREEFEAVKAMAAKARSQQEKLEKRVADLEAKWSGKPPAKAAKPRRSKPAAKPVAKPDTQG